MASASPIRIVIPDAGPLISLAMVDALDLLLIFKDQVRVVITDFVEFEVIRFRGDRIDAQRISDFIARNAGVIEIQPTQFGQSMIEVFRMKQRFDEDALFRDAMKSAGIVPSALPKDSGELSIVSFINHLIQDPPGPPVLILAEDDFFLRAGAATPGNAHVLSTRGFLETLQQLKKIASANDIWSDMQKVRPTVNEKIVDQAAPKIKTSWSSTVDDQKAAVVSGALKRRARPRGDGGPGR